MELPFRRVLLAVDGSRASGEGVQVALSLVGAMGSQVTIVHVIPPSSRPTAGPMPTEEEKSAESIVSRAQDAFAREGIKARTDLVKYGEPHGAIVRLAREGWCDLLIIGGCGDEGWGVYSVGDTAMRVARAFPGPVLLVKRRSGFSVVSVLLEVDGRGADVDFAIALAGSMGGKLNIIVAGGNEASGDVALRWAMQRACDAGVIPSGAVVGKDPGEISEVAGRHGTATLIVKKPWRGMLSRVRGGDGAYRLAADCPCSVLLL